MCVSVSLTGGGACVHTRVSVLKCVCRTVCVCVLRGFLPAVTGDVINPKGVADILFTLLLVLAEPRQDMDLIELRVNGGSLSKTRHWHCGQVKNND